MSLLIGFMLVATAALVFVGLFILWLTDKVASTAVTDQFRDAEFILEHHRAPETWAKPRGVFSRLKVHLLKRNKTPTEQKGDVLKRLDELIAFFENSPLVQDEEAKKLLLEQLAAERVDWEGKSIEEIISQPSQ